MLNAVKSLADLERVAGEPFHVELAVQVGEALVPPRGQ